MHINVTLATEDGAMVTVATISPTDTPAALSSHVAQHLHIPAGFQTFLHNGAPLAPDQPFSSVSSLHDGDLLLVRHAPPSIAHPPPSNNNNTPTLAPAPAPVSAPAPAPAPAPVPAPPPASASASASDDPFRRYLDNPRFLSFVRSAFPAVLRRALARDPNVLPSLITIFDMLPPSAPNTTPDPTPSVPAAAAASPSSSLAAAPVDDLTLDPMSIEGQQLIAEQIRQDNVRRNMEAAFEHNPESFGRVVMLFIDCTINTVPGIKALVDSGAQTTTISKECADRCRLSHLIDSRFEGVVVGVGSTKTLGRVHLALLNLQNNVFEISFTVIDSVGKGFDMLLGLDMLRKHAATIDLRNDCLRMGEVVVPFLGEKDIPLAMREVPVDQSPNNNDNNPNPNPTTNPPPPPPSITNGPSAPSPAPAASSSAAPSAAPSAAAASSSSQPIAQKVARMVELGFQKNDAESALALCDGNVERAIQLLAAAKFDS